MNTSNLPEEINISLLHEQRFIQARLDQVTFLFPSAVVTEILIVERSQILALPFYSPAMLGIIHHAGQIVPLISLHQIVGTGVIVTVERLTVVRLNDAIGAAGVGLVVDRVLGSITKEELPLELFSTALSPNSTNSEPKMRLFQPEILDSSLWQPQA